MNIHTWRAAEGLSPQINPLYLTDSEKIILETVGHQLGFSIALIPRGRGDFRRPVFLHLCKLMKSQAGERQMCRASLSWPQRGADRFSFSLADSCSSQL